MSLSSCLCLQVGSDKAGRAPEASSMEVPPEKAEPPLEPDGTEPHTEFVSVFSLKVAFHRHILIIVTTPQRRLRTAPSGLRHQPAGSACIIGIFGPAGRVHEPVLFCSSGGRAAARGRAK